MSENDSSVPHSDTLVPVFASLSENATTYPLR
jgi:hypothetical protein